jgi:hypothetical protein
MNPLVLLMYANKILKKRKITKTKKAGDLVQMVQHLP